MTAVLIVAVFLVVGIIEVKTLITKKYWRELTAFSFFWTGLFITSLLYSIGMNLPNPINAIHDFLEWIGLHY